MGSGAKIVQRELKGSLGFTTTWSWRGSPPNSGPQVGWCMTMTSQIVVCVLMDQSWQFWVRRVDSLGKTKNRLAAGQ